MPKKQNNFFVRIKRTPLVGTLYGLWLSLKTRKVESFVFVATTGRSGTDSLTTILKSIDGAITYHEPHPIMVNNPQLKRDDQFFHLVRRFESLKKVYIRRAAIGHKVYVETNHLFIKNFCYPAAIEFKEKMKVIHLYRDPISVAASFFNIGSIPGETEAGMTYLCAPSDRDNVLQLNEFIETYEGTDKSMMKCLWYYYEIEARTKRFHSIFPDIKMSHIQTKELSDFDAVLRLFSELEIEYDENTLKSVIGTHLNQKSTRKAKENNSLDREHIEQLNREILGEIQNLKLGSSLYM